MKKLVALLLAIVLCATLAPFAMADEVEIVYTGEANAPIVSAPITLKVLSATSNEQYDFDNMTYWQEALEGTNITIEMELYHWSNYADVMSTRLAAGVDLPDILFIDGNDADGAFYDAGLFVSMNEYAEKWGFNQKKFWEEYPQMKGAMTTTSGDQIFVPYVTNDKGLGRNLMLNYKLFNDNGIKIPTTTDELYDALKALKALGDWNGNGIADETPLMLDNDVYQIYQLAAAWGLNLEIGWHKQADGTVTCDWTDPAYKDYVLFLNKLMSEGLINEDFATVTYDQLKAAWSTNIPGMTYRWAGNYLDFADVLEPGVNHGVGSDGLNGVYVIDALVGPTGEKNIYSRDIFQRPFAITRDCKYPEAAYCLLDYFLNDDVVRTIWIGNEGEDWSYDADGNMVFTEQFVANENSYQAVKGANCECLPGKQKTFYYGYSDAYINLEKSIGDHIKNPIGFAFVAPEYTELLNSYKADFDTYVQESFNAFVKGTRDVEAEWDSYVEYCKALGADELTKVYQARVDASK